MNYLAHAYLSFDHPGILAGNLFSDYVKGRKKYLFPPDILRGIVLHRFIDTFTDSHPATREAKEVFRLPYRLYSGAFVDVVYDHFLANDTNEFPGDSLAAFSQNVYAELDRQQEWFPPPFVRLFPYMRSQDWLLHYKTRWGTEKSFGGLVRRAAYLTESNSAAELFEKHYQLFQDCYRHFWADAKPYARQQFDQLLSGNTDNL